ncbi:MAG: hypothetical protein K0S44_3295, partial [Bacteroidetes bacterium]|nr:hypothetical protein [Bacteroidota bacterium]
KNCADQLKIITFASQLVKKKQNGIKRQ